MLSKFCVKQYDHLSYNVMNFCINSPTFRRTYMELHETAAQKTILYTATNARSDLLGI
jgi:hypothetical protein